MAGMAIVVPMLFVRLLMIPAYQMPRSFLRASILAWASVWHEL